MSTEPNDKPAQSEEPELELEEFETTDEEGGAETLQKKLKDLRTKLQAAEAAKRESLEELQRTKADFLNSKKRLQDDQLVAIKRKEDSFVSALLPLADSFYMAMKDQTAWNAIDESWRKGVEGIHQQLKRILDSYEVQPIDPQGEHFDPNRHEAVATTEQDGESEIVLEVVQIGYERGGDVLRPAKVVISS
jgi:molecular chaperone GrpE